MYYIGSFTLFVLSIAAGMFANIHRNRSGVGWFLFSLLLTPLAGFVFLLILPVKEVLAQIDLPAPIPKTAAERTNELRAVITVIVITIIVAFTTFLAAALFAQLSHAQERPRPQPATPFINQGGCPSGYYTSGSFCAPTNPDSRPAVPKPPGANCPSGWYQSGGACVKLNR